MINKNDFYAGMRRLPTAVSIVSAEKDDLSYAMTASSVTSLSDSPPSLLVCVNKNAGLATLITDGLKLSVSVLGQDQVSISNACASTHKDSALFSESYWRRQDGHLFVNGAEVVFKCLVDRTISYATHDIVIAGISSIVLPDTATVGDPLIYYNAGYRQLSRDV